MKQLLLAVFTLFLSHVSSAQDLLESVESGNHALVESLLLAGAKVNKAAKSGQFPLWNAIWNGDTAMVRLLLKHGADADQRFTAKAGKIPGLDIACQEGHFAIVKMLVEGGADIEAKSIAAQTPLRTAARNGRTNIVQYLLDKGAEVDTQGDDRATPLEAAASKGHLDIVKLLVEKGGDVNHQDKDGDGPLGEAAKHGFEEVVKYLLSKGADVSLKNKEGHNAIELARLAGQARIADLLKGVAK
jgi:ankyrin repeat protein